MTKLIVLFFMIFSASIALADGQQQWQNLPPTPQLPQVEQSGYVSVGGAKIWYAEFGQGAPVILLHGGLANSNYWGDLVPALDSHYQVIVIDSRGQGRSTLGNQELSYDLMASDTLAVMDFLKIQKAAIVGWSDGADVGLDLVIHHPERVTKLFSFAANSNPAGSKDVSKSPVFNAYIARTAVEYRALSPTPNNYAVLLKETNKMWATEPDFTKVQLQSITVPVWIVDADHDEAIHRTDTEFMANNIPNAGLLIEPDVSHFAFLQDPVQFNTDVLHFLNHVQGASK